MNTLQASLAHVVKDGQARANQVLQPCGAVLVATQLLVVQTHLEFLDKSISSLDELLGPDTSMTNATGNWTLLHCQCAMAYCARVVLQITKTPKIQDLC